MKLKPGTADPIGPLDVHELRRWAVEQTIEASRHGLMPKSIIAAANELEAYVLNGAPAKADKDPP